MCVRVAIVVVLAGGRVDAVVGDDLEAVLFRDDLSYRHSVHSGRAGLHHLQPDLRRRVSQAAISPIENGRLDAR